MNKLNISQENYFSESQMEAIVKNHKFENNIDYDLFHISPRNDLAGVIYPREILMGEQFKLSKEKYNTNEPIFARICTSPTIRDCVVAVIPNYGAVLAKDDCEYLEFNIYKASKNDLKKIRIFTPEDITNYLLVADAFVTREHMLLDPCKFTNSGKFRVPVKYFKYREDYHMYNIKEARNMRVLDRNSVKIEYL